MSKEYYLREIESEKAIGPYSLEQVQSLAEAGQISPKTLYFDHEKEVWISIKANMDLNLQVFPQKKSLSLRKPEDPLLDGPTDDEEDDPGQELKVEDMLAAAEGKSADTKHLKKQIDKRESSASILLPVLSLSFILSSVAFVLPHYPEIADMMKGNKFTYDSILEFPSLIMAFVDLMLALAMLLRATSLFPIVRVRALVGLGYFGYVGFAMLEFSPLYGMITLGAMICLHVGILVNTMTLKLGAVLLASALSICGGLALLWPIIAQTFLSNQ